MRCFPGFLLAILRDTPCSFVKKDSLMSSAYSKVLSIAYRWRIVSDYSWLLSSCYSMMFLFTCSKTRTLSSVVLCSLLDSWSCESSSSFLEMRVTFRSCKQLHWFKSTSLKAFESWERSEFSNFDDKIVFWICLLISSDSFTCSSCSVRFAFSFSKYRIF